MWLRLRQIALVAEDLDAAVERLRAVFGLEVCFRDRAVAHFGLVNALLPVGDQLLEVVAPLPDAGGERSAAGRYLARRGGPGGYMVISQCDDHAPRRRRVEQLGIRVVGSLETAAFRHLQLHPKDTGGSFLEIDEQLGPRAHASDGPWEPAGGAAWTGARRTERVAGIRAAEIQADDPVRVAARWAEITELPVALRDGTPTLDLDNASLRFVPCRDGRPEGLGALDLETRDRAAVLAAAEAVSGVSGGVTGAAQVTLCGVRFNLL